MKHVPYWAQGGLFFVAFPILIFILKITCPVDLGCFADPFLIPLFSPLLLVERFGTLGSYEPVYIILFWAVVGTLFGFLTGKIFGQEKREVITNNEE